MSQACHSRGGTPLLQAHEAGGGWHWLRGLPGRHHRDFQLPASLLDRCAGSCTTDCSCEVTSIVCRHSQMPGSHREPQRTFSAERDFPDFIQLSVGSLVLRTLDGRLHQATIKALGQAGLQPESEVTIPAGIQRSKPHCFCIKMTRGSFVDYTRSCLLHCGISNAQGQVYNFDQHGYHLDRWRESISVPLDGLNALIDVELAAHDRHHRQLGEP